MKRGKGRKKKLLRLSDQLSEEVIEKTEKRDQTKHFTTFTTGHWSRDLLVTIWQSMTFYGVKCGPKWTSNRDTCK